MRPRTILLVDDHDAVRAGLRDWFRQRRPDVEVVEAASGEDALACAAARTPDLVLMDVELPGMNGLEATRRLKAALPQVPVIIVTLHDAQPYRAEAAKVGASAYVLKHLVQSDLLRVVKQLLPEGERPHDEDGMVTCDVS